VKLQLGNIFRKFIGISFSFALLANTTMADAIERAAFGADAASIQAAVDQFRADLGALNPTGPRTFTNGRREINWDDGPSESLAAPNVLPADFFNIISARGVVFSSTAGPLITGTFLQSFQISSSPASGVPLRFGNINPSYTNEFQTFSSPRLFTTTEGSNVLEIEFFIPGTRIPATVNGFGAVFTDVDGPSTRMLFYDDKGKVLFTPNGPVAGIDKGLSFQGVSYDDGTRISKVQIILGNAPLSATNTDGVNGVDVVAMDDFIYGEPRAAEYHAGDFDGDGTADIAVFRPSDGNWFVINSGTNTITVVQWGTNGDIPVDGDYDGDKRSDLTVFRPTTGQWFTLRSSDSQVAVTSWGIEGDKPLSGDFDKDGKTDIAVFRPSDGNHYILKSSNGPPLVTTWGTIGDIPIMGAP
jgi:hypothetical protein